MATLPFEHLVVLMMENRSFDHMLGSLKSDTYPIEGLDINNLPTNVSPDGGAAIPVTFDARTVGDLNPDPAHDFLNVNVQIFGNKDATVSGPLMRGFAKAYAAATGDSSHAPTLPNCFTPPTLPLLPTL